MELKIVSFNLRCVYKGDGVNAFLNRSGLIRETIAAEMPDVIGFQEGTDEIIRCLRQLLPEYILINNGREADYGGEQLVIALRRDTVSLVTLDCFWLSETPFVPGSRYAHQSQCPRICQTAVVRSIATGEIFRVSNNHLDHVSDEARILGIRQVLGYLQEQQQRTPCPVFILGDFNAYPDSETVQFCNTYAPLPIVDLTAESGGTYHDFGRREPVKIDYIYTDKKTAVKPFTCKRWETTLGGIYLSDHYPVAVSITL